MTALLTTSTPANVAAEPYLSLENVSKTYSTPKGDYPVLRDINLSVNEGEFVCLVGHSGCGKTTLLNMVSGFAQPTSGSVKLKGQPITAPGPERMVVFQGYALLPWLTVYENVYLAVRSVFPQKSQSEKHRIVEEHLDLQESARDPGGAGREWSRSARWWLQGHWSKDSVPLARSAPGGRPRTAPHQYRG